MNLINRYLNTRQEFLSVPKYISDTGRVTIDTGMLNESTLASVITDAVNVFDTSAIVTIPSNYYTNTIESFENQIRVLQARIEALESRE